MTWTQIDITCILSLLSLMALFSLPLLLGCTAWIQYHRPNKISILVDGGFKSSCNPV